MKLKYMSTIAIFFAVAIFMWATPIKAQISGHNYVVQWKDGSGNLILDALYDAVMGDTVMGGGRADPDRVYILQRGGYYWDSKTITNNGFTLRLEGETPGNTLETAPAVIQFNTNAGTASGKIMQIYDDINFKNLYIIGSDENGVQGSYYQPIEIEGANLHCYIDSCVFERADFAIMAWNGKNNNVYFTNCKFRNLIERTPTQQWTGRGISMWTDEDTVVVENCTFFNVNMTAFQLEGGAAKYFRFNHNTLVNIGRSVHSTSGTWWREAYFTNCLLVNVFWDGEGACDYAPYYQPGRDPRAYTTGYFAVGPLPGTYGPETGRRIAISNMAAFLDPYFKTQYGDTIRAQGYTNAVTDSFFTTYSPSNGGQMVIQDTTWMNSYPNFTNNPDDAALTQAMWTFITNVRGYQFYNEGTHAVPYYYDLQTDPNSGDTLWTSPTWPLPENFAYTTQSLMTASTDGLPLGDLNWFPLDLKTWEANKTAEINKIQNIPGAKFSYNVDTLAEAEDGTLGGTAATEISGGFAYYEFQSGGDIHWTFNLSSAVTNCKLVVYTNMDNNTVRGENIYVNGTNLQNNSGYGEYHFTVPPLSASAWDSVTIIKDSLVAGSEALDLPSGTNTLEIKKSWGYQFFSGFSIYDASGNLITKMSIPEADMLSGGIPHLEGSAWAPSGFKFVSLGSGGDITWSLNVPSDGIYGMQAFFQNTSGTQMGTLSMDGSSIGSISFASNTDSTEQNLLSPTFSATAGMHTFKLSGMNANVDYVQLVEKVVTGISSRKQLPTTFELSQNYPNPFNPTTNIKFSLGAASNVKLIVYNILGQKVVTLVNNYMTPGTHLVKFNATNLASGVYLYRLEAGNVRLSKKMILLK